MDLGYSFLTFCYWIFYQNLDLGRKVSDVKDLLQVEMYGPFMVFPHGAGVDVASLLMCRRPGRIPIANFIGVKLQSR